MDTAKNKLSSLAEKYKDLMEENKTDSLFEKGMWICKDNPVGNILIAGMNPAGKEVCKFGVSECSFINCINSSRDYWESMKSIMPASIISTVAYLDLFPVHEGKQIKAEEKLTIEIARKMLVITHKEIERISPMLIIIANKRSAAYWGLYQKWSWMDYDFSQRIPETELPLEVQGLGLEVYQIRGYKGSGDRITSGNKTNLEGSIAINYGYHNAPYQSERKNRWTIPHTISPETFLALFDFAKKKKLFLGSNHRNIPISKR